MNWSEFENDMKGWVDEHQTPVDTEALWDKLQQKRRKPLLFWWWLSAAGLSVAGLLFWVSSQDIKTTDAVEPETSTPTEMVQSAPTRSVQLQSTPGADPNLVQEDLELSPKSFETITEVDFAASTLAKSTNSKGVTPGSQMQEIVAVQEPKNADFIDRIPGKTVEAATTAQRLTTNSVAQLTAIEEPSSTNPSSFATIATQLVPVEMPAVKMPEPKAVLYVSAPAQTPGINTKTTKNSSRLGLNLGYDRWQSASQLPDHQSGSRPLESVSLALEWSKPIAKNWSVQTGLAYARTTRLLSLERTWDTQKKKATTNYYADGSTAIDSFFVTVERTRKIRHYNRWQQIGIPVSLQYRFAMGKGILLPQLGLQASWLCAKGIGISKANDPDPKLFEKQYQQLFLLQAHAGFDWMFALGDRYSVSVGPRFQFDLTPRSSKNATQAERFWQGGVQVGVSYKL